MGTQTQHNPDYTMGPSLAAAENEARSTKEAHETYTRNTIVIEFDPSRKSIPQLHDLNYAIARNHITLCKKGAPHLKSALNIISAVMLHRRGI